MKRERTESIDKDANISNENKVKKQKVEVPEIPEVFADPTLDITFKMLFAQDKNKDILISLLNSLLNFSGEQAIVDVEINHNELAVSNVGSDSVLPGITSAVDILCTNKGRQKIAIEIQGQKQNYFLACEQEYMSKLISGQVKEGQGKAYHEKVLDTYIIVIGKSNMFTGNTKLLDHKIFEIDVEPRVVQTNQTVPGNKMHWKFYELPKFKDSVEYKNIDKGSIIKYQWLEFLLDCSKKEIEPDDRDELIQKGYDIMKVAKWDADTQALYWKARTNEIDAIEQWQLDIDTARTEALQEGLAKGELKGKQEGLIKGEINTVKTLIKFNIPQEKIFESLHVLNHVVQPDQFHNMLDFISAQITETVDQLYDAMLGGIIIHHNE
jgi:predicted transposase/invertase (TIGR01784 family)